MLWNGNAAPVTGTGKMAVYSSLRQKMAGNSGAGKRGEKGRDCSGKTGIRGMEKIKGNKTKGNKRE